MLSLVKIMVYTDSKLYVKIFKDNNHVIQLFTSLAIWDSLVELNK